MISPVIKEAKRTKTVGQEKIAVKPALRTLHNYVEFSLIPQKTISYNLFLDTNTRQRGERTSTTTTISSTVFSNKLLITHCLNFSQRIRK